MRGITNTDMHREGEREREGERVGGRERDICSKEYDMETDLERNEMKRVIQGERKRGRV